MVHDWYSGESLLQSLNVLAVNLVLSEEDKQVADQHSTVPSFTTKTQHVLEQSSLLRSDNNEELVSFPWLLIALLNGNIMLINISSSGLLLASLTSGLPNEQRISDMGHNDCIQVSFSNLGLVRIFTSILIFFNFKLSIFCVGRCCHGGARPWWVDLQGLTLFDLIVRYWFLNS